MHIPKVSRSTAPAAAILAASLLLVLAPLDRAAAVRIKLATKAPENFKSAQLIKAMTREIQEKTQGTVRFKIYYGGVKGTGRDLLLKMRSGEIQGGEFTSGEASSVLKDLSLISFPFIFRNYKEVDFVLGKMAPRFEEELAERGYVVLGWLEIGFAYIMSTHPVATLDDLHHRKVWIPQGDPIGQATFEAMGVSPIPMPIADVMVALQTGQIDTVANSFMGTIALQWHTRIRYVTDIPLLYAYGLVMITREAYERIPEAYRETVREIMSRSFRKLHADIRKNNVESRETLKRQGIRFLSVAPGELEKIEGIVEQVKKDLEGKVFTREGLDRMQGYLDEYRRAH